MDATTLPYPILSVLRLLMLAAILAVSLGVALLIGLGLASMGTLGTCQDGTCELVAAVYVMPIGGVLLYFATLITLSILANRRRQRHDV